MRFGDRHIARRPFSLDTPAPVAVPRHPLPAFFNRPAVPRAELFAVRLGVESADLSVGRCRRRAGWFDLARANPLPPGRRPIEFAAAGSRASYPIIAKVCRLGVDLRFRPTEVFREGSVGRGRKPAFR